jgi:aldehyde dehydrogenase (NAD+)
VAKPKIKHTQLFIDGHWMDAQSGKAFGTYCPSTEEKIASVAEGDAVDINLAVKAARSAFDHGPWRRMDARQRGQLMMNLAGGIEEHTDELAALESLDNGKPIRGSLAIDLPMAIHCLRYYAGYADKIHGQTIPINSNFLCYTRREPVGVAGQIIPWNFTMLMTAWKWGPALAAGCTIVMKPAKQIPLTCVRMAALAQQDGIPDGVINVVPGFRPTAGAAMVEHPRVDKVAFTGETTTAQTIMRNAANSLKRLTFELGGKSSNVVFADCNLDAAVNGSHFGLYLNQGQCCCAGSRVFIEETIYDEFVERLASVNKNENWTIH